MLKLKGQNINQLLLYVDLFICFICFIGCRFFEKCFKRTEKGTFKIEKLKDEPCEGLGQEIVQNVAQTRT